MTQTREEISLAIKDINSNQHIKKYITETVDALFHWFAADYRHDAVNAIEWCLKNDKTISEYIDK